MAKGGTSGQPMSVGMWGGHSRKGDSGFELRWESKIHSGEGECWACGGVEVHKIT